LHTVPAWLLPGSQLVPQIRLACEAGQRRDREEYQRLLYVAMTRARDRLYVAGFEGTRGRDKGCWYDLISEGLETRLTEATDSLGGTVLRMDCPQTAPVPESAGQDVTPASPGLPDWAVRHPAAEAPRALLLNPSRLELPPHQGRAQEAVARPRNEALLRGRVVHRLLELLPAIPPRDRQSAGARFLAAEARLIPQRQRGGLLADVLAILGDAEFGEVFGPGSQAEVALAAELPPFAPGERPAIISGQVDRLVCAADAIFIVDFKSGAAVPASAEAAPMAYIAQLAAYRLALARLFPGKPVRAALLWTDGPRLMQIGAALLDQGETVLYESLRSRHLDLPPSTP